MIKFWSLDGTEGTLGRRGQVGLGKGGSQLSFQYSKWLEIKDVYQEVVGAVRAMQKVSRSRWFATSGKNVNLCVGTKIVETLSGHSEDVTCLLLDPTKRYLFTGGADHKILKWNVFTGCLLQKLVSGTSG